MNSISSDYFTLKNKLKIALTFLFSWVIVAYGQPSWSPILGVFSSLFGFALFWRALIEIQEKKKRFYLSWIWFVAVEAIHLSWMCATEYQGKYIYIVYSFFILAIGLQFAIFSSFISKKDSLNLSRVLFLCGLWTLMEWIRLFFMSGFPFNPVGLTLTSTLWGKQAVSIAGIYFLSFWVILTNLCVLKCFLYPKKIQFWILFVFTALLPYFWGIHQIQKHSSQIEAAPKVQALLVQTALSPEEKTGMKGFEYMMPPLTQWSHIFSYLAPYQKDKIDLIVLPERSVPFSDQTKLYEIEHLGGVIRSFFGERGERLVKRMAGSLDVVDNTFLSQFLAHYFQAQVIVGLEYLDNITENDYEAYASAFSFQPDQPPEVYYKRVLLPIVEYLPFKWCEDLAKKYQIFGWYKRGEKPKVFSGNLAVAPSICIEELYGGLIRKNRKLGGELFVNITNDVWFPNSKLPWQHFDHGSIRSIENGTPLLRSCNTGVTAGVDALGRTIACFNNKHKISQWKRGALKVSLPRYQFSTPYLLLGDAFFLVLSLLCVSFFFLPQLFVKLKFYFFKYRVKF